MVGTVLGHYRIIEKLGSGGMGEVYRAEDLRLLRQVAIKVLPADVAGDATRMQRLEREARAVAALNHPNIAAIYGLEETDHSRALVLELVPGQTLLQRLARGGCPSTTRSRSAFKSLPVSRPRMSKASSTETSSRPTSSSHQPEWPRSWTSAWRRQHVRDVRFANTDGER